MARNMQPIAKRCKALNLSPAAMGYAKKESNRNPGGQMRNLAVSAFLVRIQRLVGPPLLFHPSGHRLCGRG